MYLVPLIGIAVTLIGVFLVYRNLRKDETQDVPSSVFANQESENASSGEGKEGKRKLFGFGLGKKDGKFLSAQEFLGIKDIRNGTIVLNNGQKRIVFEVDGTINFPLLSHNEQVAVEDSFAAFLSSLDFPIQIYVQSRLLDMTPSVNSLIERLHNAPEHIRRYGLELASYLNNWLQTRSIMIRKNYIIVGVDDDDPKTSSEYVFSVISSGLARCGLECRRLSTEEILEMLYVTMNKYRANWARIDDILVGIGNLFVAGGRNPLVKGKEVKNGAKFPLIGGVTGIMDIVSDGFLEKENYIQVGSRYTRVYSVIEMPPRVHIGFLEDLYSLDDVDVSFHLWPAETYEAVNYLTKAITKLEAQRIQDERRGDITNLSVLTRAAEDLWQLREKVQTNEDKIFYASIIISVSDDTIKGLEHKCKILEAKLGGRGVHLRSAFLRQAEAYRSVMPFCRNELWDIRKNFNLGAGVSIFPFTNAELAHPGGVFIGRNMFTNSPVFLNLFVGPPVLNNKHFVILAQPGSGKSYLAKGLASRSLCYGVRIVFIDPEGEYVALTRERKGQVISFRPGEEPLINPFDLEEEVDSKGNKKLNLQEKILEMKRLILVMVKGANPDENLTTEEVAVLEEVLSYLYSKRNITEDPNSLYEKFSHDSTVGFRKKDMPTLSELVETLRERGYTKLATILMPYTRGRSLGLFDGPSKVSLSDADMICFDFSRLEETFMRPLAMHVALNWIWEKFVKRDNRTRKMVICDEAWMYMKYKDSAEFLNDAARRGRKRNMSLGVVSQYPQEFISTPEGRAVLSSAATKILMRQSPNDIPAVQELFKLNEGQTRFINSCAVGEALVMCEGKVGVFSTAVAVEASEQEDILFNTDPEREELLTEVHIEDSQVEEGVSSSLTTGGV